MGTAIVGGGVMGLETAQGNERGPSDGDEKGPMHLFENSQHDKVADVGATLSCHKRSETKHTQLAKVDAKEAVDLERRDETLSLTCGSAQDKTVIAFSHDDPENPCNWSSTRKALIVLTGVTTVINSTVGTSLPSGAVRFIAKDFHVANQQQLVLPTSIYLVGYVLGPLLFGPLSETYGRKWTIISTFALFTGFTLGCALAPNWPAFIIFRLIVGISASCPLTVVGGLYADIYDDPVPRGRAMGIFMAATTFGPVLSPSISGFISVITWRWTFWVALILAGVSWLPLIFMPETYAPVILKNRARKMRKKTGNPNVYAPIEIQEKSISRMLVQVLTRAIRMLLFEGIVLSSCLYMALAYAIFFMFFQAYPIVYEGTYQFNAGEEGLTFISIGVGAVIACGIYLYYDHMFLRAKHQHRAWASSEEYRRLPLTLLGGPLFVISLFWLGWTATPHVHWIVPVLAGVPFGIGFLLIFISLTNYLVDAYSVYAASAVAAATCSRSIFATVLPFAARPMYERLGVGWACSLLGFVSAGMSLVPFVFIKYGDRIRAKSPFCQQLAEEKREKAADEERRAEEQQMTSEENV